MKRPEVKFAARPAPSGSPAPDAGGNLRWVVCSLLFFSVGINYLDRLVLSILKNDLSAVFDWSETDYGWITAAFSFAYAFGYLLGGRFLDRVGVRGGLPVLVLLWSAAAMAHGLGGFIDPASRFGLELPWFSWAEKAVVWTTLSLPMTAGGFILARIALGLAEGGNFPGAIRAVAEWFPVSERAYATGLFNAGTNFGAVFCPIAVPWLFVSFGWQATFCLTGATGFLWVVAWWCLYEAPEKHPRLSAAENQYIRRGQPAGAPEDSPIPWSALLRYRAVWAFLLANILTSPAWGFYQFFLPDFLNKHFNLETQAAGWWTAVFFGLAAVGGVAGGWFAGKLIDRGWSVPVARKITLLICALAVGPLFVAPLAGSVWLAVLIVGVAGAAHQGWSANLFSIVSDTMPKGSISSVVGLGGFVAHLTGGMVSILVGQILHQTGSYVPVFIYFSGVYLLALLGIQLLLPTLARPLQPATT